MILLNLLQFLIINLCLFKKILLFSKLCLPHSFIHFLLHSYGLGSLFFFASFAPILSFPWMHFNFPGMLILTFKLKIYFSRSLNLNLESTIILLYRFFNWLIDFEAVCTKFVIQIHSACSKFTLTIQTNLFALLGLIKFLKVFRIFCRERLMFYEMNIFLIINWLIHLRNLLKGKCVIW